MSRCGDLFGVPWPVIGVCHLPPFPDYPGSPGLEALCAHALADFAAMRCAGLAGILLENEHDRPHRVRARRETLAAMTAIASAVVAAGDSPVAGCEILLNDPVASLDAAHAGGASFIRTDYFVDRMQRPGYGEFDIDPEGLIRYRAEIHAEDVLVLADIQVKYASMLEPRPIRESARLAVLRRADAVVVSGSATGSAPTVADLRAARLGVRDAGGDAPVLIGSGLDAGNAETLLPFCDGAIVGTSLMVNGRVDFARAQALMDILARLQT